MNREIKFRAWTGKKMLHNVGMHPYLIFRCDDVGLFDPEDTYTEGENIVVSPKAYEVMQYTGLKDKNGVEIYEGDVIKLFYGHPSWLIDPFEVVFMNGAFAMKKPDKNGSTSFAVYLHDCLQEGIITGDSDDSFLFEVIGNIHQHLELLKHS